MTQTKNGSAKPRTQSLIDDWLTPWRFCALLAVMLVITFPDVIFGQRTFVFRDFGLFTYPVAHYFRESFWRGEVPLWNPYSNCGLPFLAQWNTMVLYPPALFYLLLPLSWSLGVFCLLHLFLAGLGMYWLAWRWTNSRLGACVAGAAFAYGGLMLSSLIWTTNLAALAWMPWVVLTVEKAWREGGRAVIYAALVGALQMLSGAPEIILFTWLVLALLALIEFSVQRSQLASRCGRFVLTAVLIGGLAAAQLLPFLDLLRHSERHGEISSSLWSMPPWGWANFLVPLFRCYQPSAGVYFQSAQSWISSYYLGIGVFALALVAALRVREWQACLLGAVALLGMVLALGDDGLLYRGLRQFLPVFGFMRYPIKFIVLAGFAVPLLAAFAVRELAAPVSESKSRPWRLTAWLSCFWLLLIFFIVLFAHRYPWEYEKWTVTLQSGLTRALFLTLIVGVLYGLARIDHDRIQRLLSIGLIVLVWFDLITHTPSQNPTVERSVFQTQLPILRELKPLPRPGESRAMLTGAAINEFKRTMLANPFNTFLLQRVGLFDNCNLLDGIPKVDGFFSLHLEAEQQVQQRWHARTNAVSPGLPDFLGVSQITSPTNIFQWQARASYLPWITSGQRLIFADTAATLQALVSQEFDPRKTVYLPPEAQRLISATNATGAKILSSRFSAHEIVLETEARASAILVVAQAHYHLWQPFVDKRPATLWRANHAFQAIEIPEGRHEVRLLYKDRNFYFGVVVSVGTLLVCVAALLLLRLKRRS